MLKISEILRDFCKTYQTRSIHIDEFLPEHLLTTKESIFFNSIKLYNDIISDSEKFELPLVQVDLQFELNNLSNIVNGVPQNIDSLIDLIDEISMPEVSVFIPRKEFWHPKLEMYLCPIPFEIKEISDGIFTLYEEYRTLDESKEGDEFSKWLTFSYVRDRQ